MSVSVGALPLPLIRKAVDAALLEDLGRAGDVTTAATIPLEAKAAAAIVTREQGVIAGMELAAYAFESIGGPVEVARLVANGASVSSGDPIIKLSGSAQSILSAERVALNFLGHLSGIATVTRQYADAISHTNARITCTRKTTPGLRAFEKHAVKSGGGSNHRFGLDDAILIKDNHIAVNGSVAETIRRARAFAGHLVKIEVEVDTIDQLREALEASPDAVLLDNMSPDTLRKAVEIADGTTILEASGGITLESIATVAETGVDYISSGWITHSASSLDLGLDIEIKP